MIKYMNKVIHEKEKGYQMPYGYFLNNVFNKFWVIRQRGFLEQLDKSLVWQHWLKINASKKRWELCHVSKLLAAYENLSKETKDMQNQMLSSRGPSSTEKLPAKNAKLQAKVIEITGEVQDLNCEVKTFLNTCWMLMLLRLPE